MPARARTRRASASGAARVGRVPKPRGRTISFGIDAGRAACKEAESSSREDTLDSMACWKEEGKLSERAESEERVRFRFIVAEMKGRLVCPPCRRHSF
jgi:hypothetical protein